MPRGGVNTILMMTSAPSSRPLDRLTRPSSFALRGLTSATSFPILAPTMRAPYRTFLQVPILVTVYASLAMAAPAGDKNDSIQEFLRAAALTDIRAQDSPPFELDANVDIRG